MSINYRVGTPEDVPGLVLFLQNIKKENPLVDKFTYDLGKMADTLRRILNNDQGVILIAEKNDIIVGTIVLGKTTIWWSNTSFLTDLAFYVNPEYRSQGIQKKLLSTVKEFADQLKMPILVDVFNASEENMKITRFLGMNGFKNVGFKALYTPT